MRNRSRMRRALVNASLIVGGTTFMNSGCSSEAINAFIIGLNAAAGQIENENRDVTFEDWLESEFDDIFDD